MRIELTISAVQKRRSPIRSSAPTKNPTSSFRIVGSRVFGFNSALRSAITSVIDNGAYDIRRSCGCCRCSCNRYASHLLPIPILDHKIHVTQSLYFHYSVCQAVSCIFFKNPAKSIKVGLDGRPDLVSSVGLSLVLPSNPSRSHATTFLSPDHPCVPPAS